MPARASIESLEWENRFFGVNSAILRFGDDAPPLTVDALANWARVQAKVAADDTARLDALQAFGFRLVEGEVDLALSPAAYGDSGAEPATEADIPRLRELAALAFAQSRFRAPWYAADASGRFYAQWIKMRCAAPSIINVWCFAPLAAISARLSPCASLARTRQGLACWPDAEPERN